MRLQGIDIKWLAIEAVSPHEEYTIKSQKASIPGHRKNKLKYIKPQNSKVMFVVSVSFEFSLTPIILPPKRERFIFRQSCSEGVCI